MDKPIVQIHPPSHRGSRGGGDGIAQPCRRRDHPRGDLRAARDRLVEVGYANLNVRDIAREAGVNHALIGYHFHGKQQLVLAVLDEANRQLLDRQERMYQGTTSASRQWQQACDFYEEDLKSGFVRLLMELMGASFHDLELRREFVPRISQWHRLVRARGRSSSSTTPGSTACLRRGHRGLDRLVLDRDGGQHDARHRREGRPPARGARGGRDPPAPGRRAHEDTRAAEAARPDDGDAARGRGASRSRPGRCRRPARCRSRIRTRA